MKGQSRRTAEHQHIPRLQPERAGRIAPLGAADPEQRGIAQRHRHDRRIEGLFVAVLMQAHTGGRLVIIDQTGLGRQSVCGHILPQRGQFRRHRRPGPACDRMIGLVAIARPVGHPAQTAAIGHADRERLVGFGHGRGKKRRGFGNLAQLTHQRAACIGIVIAGIMDHAGKHGDSLCPGMCHVMFRNRLVQA